MRAGAHFKKALALILVSAFGTCVVLGCELGDFPEKKTFWARSFQGSFTCPPDGERPHDDEGRFHVELINRTNCQYIGGWPEFDGKFVGFYNHTTRILFGSWYIGVYKAFGGMAFEWDGTGMIGPWLQYPNDRGCDIITPYEEAQATDFDKSTLSKVL